MDTPREENVDGWILWPTPGLEQHVNHGLPEHEAGARAHVPSALAPFEDEAMGAILQVHLQETRRRCVQVGCDTFLLKAVRLVGSAAGNERPGWPHLTDHLHLLLA